MIEVSKDLSCNEFAKQLEATYDTIEAMPFDASFRRYYRLHNEDKTSIIMHCPPPHEDWQPFLKITNLLQAHGYSVPQIYAINEAYNILHIEDFGTEVFAKILTDKNEKRLYCLAVDFLIDLETKKIPENIAYYDFNTYLRESIAFFDWYLEYKNIKYQSSYKDYFTEELENLVKIVQVENKCLVLRDFHVENMLYLSDRAGLKQIGLIDYQDALIGSPYYDLVSLLDDARREIKQSFRDSVVKYFIENTGRDESLVWQHYQILGMQRNMKIIGYFTRKFLRDGTDKYLQYLPRMFNYLKDNLQHDTLQNINRILIEINAV